MTSNSPGETRTVNRVCAATYSWSKHNPIEEDTDLSDIDKVAYDSDHEFKSDESGCLELILLNRRGR